MRWVIPSEPWAQAVLTIRDTFDLSMNEAARLLAEHGTPDVVFDFLTKE